MGDRNLTLFALHTHGDTQFGPSSVPGVGSDDADAKSDATSKAKSLFGKRSDDAEDEETAIEPSAGDEESGGGSLGALLVALVVLAGIAMAAKKLGGSDDADVDLAESDDL